MLRTAGAREVIAWYQFQYTPLSKQNTNGSNAWSDHWPDPWSGQVSDVRQYDTIGRARCPPLDPTMGWTRCQGVFSHSVTFWDPWVGPGVGTCRFSSVPAHGPTHGRTPITHFHTFHTFRILKKNRLAKISQIPITKS